MTTGDQFPGDELGRGATDDETTVERSVGAGSTGSAEGAQAGGTALPEAAGAASALAEDVERRKDKGKRD